MVFEDNKVRNRHMQARQLLGRARRLMLYARTKNWRRIIFLQTRHSCCLSFIITAIIIPDHRITLASCLNRLIGEKYHLPADDDDGKRRTGKKNREVPKSNQLSFELTEKGLDAFHKSKDWKTDKAIMSALSKEELTCLWLC